MFCIKTRESKASHFYFNNYAVTQKLQFFSCLLIFTLDSIKYRTVKYFKYNKQGSIKVKKEQKNIQNIGKHKKLCKTFTFVKLQETRSIMDCKHPILFWQPMYLHLFSTTHSPLLPMPLRFHNHPPFYIPG